MSKIHWQTQTRRQRVQSGLLLAVVIGALAAVAIRDPRTYGLGPLCPSLRLFGIHCPGCGSTRATHDLMHGEVASAFRCNPLMVLVGAPLLAYVMCSLGCAALTGQKPHGSAPPWLGYGIAALLIAWCVARNLPGPTFDALRPPSVNNS
jgi:hypothetical protein